MTSSRRTSTIRSTVDLRRHVVLGGAAEPSRHASPRSREAAALLRRHTGANLVTSNHVRGETWTYLRRRAGHAAAVEFLDTLSGSARIQVPPVEDGAERAAIRWLRQHDEREYSFVDATSFAVMKVHRVREAFAFDGDFSAAGFIELRP